MTKKSNTDLDRDKLRFWTAVVNLIAKIPDFIDVVIKVVSYDNRYTKFRVQL